MLRLLQSWTHIFRIIRHSFYNNQYFICVKYKQQQCIKYSLQHSTTWNQISRDTGHTLPHYCKVAEFFSLPFIKKKKKESLWDLQKFSVHPLLLTTQDKHKSLLFTHVWLLYAVHDGTSGVLLLVWEELRQRCTAGTGCLQFCQEAKQII